MQFETAEHFYTDYVNFMVVDFDNTYHTILGRPALTKFMAMLHYSYLVLKNMYSQHFSVLGETWLDNLPVLSCSF
jgi:hypothetical protein